MASKCDSAIADDDLGDGLEGAYLPLVDAGPAEYSTGLEKLAHGVK